MSIASPLPPSQRMAAPPNAAGSFGKTFANGGVVSRCLMGGQAVARVGGGAGGRIAAGLTIPITQWQVPAAGLNDLNPNASLNAACGDGGRVAGFGGLSK